MASIAISDLRPTGTALFQDAESFLNELNENEVENVLGGGSFKVIWTSFCVSW
ncbi:hypothetical protein [Coleofasciculus sp. F4-SAH-05]|uniref:hypothetical protein n=1 Tax=Coleofasciculus sp. F4-SAH-05 TaxID=3069525 RepID=UPI0032F8D250